MWLIRSNSSFFLRPVATGGTVALTELEDLVLIVFFSLLLRKLPPPFEITQRRRKKLHIFYSAPKSLIKMIFFAIQGSEIAEVPSGKKMLFKL